MNVNLKQLKPKLNFIKRNVRPILTRIKVNKDTLECNDLETFVTIKDNHGMKEGLQKYETLGLIESLPNDDDYPTPSIDRSHRDFISIDLDKVERCLQFVSKDETRLFLNGVAVNKGHLVATDGHTMKAFKLVDKLENNYIMPSSSLKVLLKLCKGYKLTGSMRFELNEKWATVECSKFKVSFRLIQREYPRWEAIIPTKFNHTVAIEFFDIAVNHKELFLDSKNHSCKLESKAGEVYLTAKNYPNDSFMIGRCDKELEFTLGFNYSYLVRAANKRNEFGLKFNNELSPMEINEAIVMPLKL